MKWLATRHTPNKFHKLIIGINTEHSTQFERVIFILSLWYNKRLPFSTRKNNFMLQYKYVNVTSDGASENVIFCRIIYRLSSFTLWVKLQQLTKEWKKSRKGNDKYRVVHGGRRKLITFKDVEENLAEKPSRSRKKNILLDYAGAPLDGSVYLDGKFITIFLLSTFLLATRWLITRRVRNKAKFSVAYLSFRVSYLQGWDCRRAPKFIRLQVIERGKWRWVARDNLTRDWDSWEIINIFYPPRSRSRAGEASRAWLSNRGDFQHLIWIPIQICLCFVMNKVNNSSKHELRVRGVAM